MNIRRAIARWLGYGGIEWPKSAIVDLPIKIVDTWPYPDTNIVQVCCYPGGVQVLPNEFGYNAENRLLYPANVYKLWADKVEVFLGVEVDKALRGE